MMLTSGQVGDLRPRAPGGCSVVVHFQHAADGQDSQSRFGVDRFRSGQVLRESKDRGGQTGRFRVGRDLAHMRVKRL